MAALQHIIGDDECETDDAIAACKVLIDALDNSSFVALLGIADQAAAAAS